MIPISLLAACLNTAAPPLVEKDQERRAPPSVTGRLGAITLKNTLTEPVLFLYKPLHEGTIPTRSWLQPGATRGFKGNVHIEIKLLSEELSLRYWLFPGERYVVKDVGLKGHKDLRIFKMVRGDPSAVDLAPHVPTPEAVIDRVLELSGVSADSVLFDLGCGDGCVLIRAAEKFGARCVGVDINPRLIRLARKSAAAVGVSSRVTFLHQDIFDTDISSATIVYLYLYPDSLKLLRPYLENNLKIGTTVVSFGYHFPGWEEKRLARIEIEGEFLIPKILHIYRR